MNRRTFVAGSLGALAATQGGVGLGAQAAATGAAADVQVMVFDTFGTVVDWRSAVIAEGQALGKAKGIAVDWPAFADAWRAGYGPSMDRVRKGEIPWTILDVLHRRTLDDLLVRFRIDGLSEAEKDHLNRVWHRLKGWPDSVAGLTRLRKRYVIAPLSNGNLALLTNMAKFAGLPWDCILSTELVRHYKPDKETYLMPGEFFAIPPAKVMMVAAHIGDLQAAKDLGLKTAYVHRPVEYGPARPSKPPEPGRFDYSVKDMKELATAMGT